MMTRTRRLVNGSARGASWLLAFATAWSCVECRAGGHGSATEAAEEPIDEAKAKDRGIELGEFRIRSYYPVQAQKSVVRFVLYATAQPGRFGETQQLVKTRKHKVRDQVITATRLAPLADFDEPDLDRFRRRLLLRLRRTLPELALRDVYVSAFELKVQSL